MENILREVLSEIQDLKQTYKGDMQILKEDVRGLKEDVRGLKEDVRGLKEDVHNLEDEQQTMKSMLASQGDHIHQLLKMVATTNRSTEELKEDLVDVETVQSAHERILEHLSLRSLTHEADITDLRRIQHL